MKILLGSSAMVITATIIVIPLIGLFFSRIQSLGLLGIGATLRWLTIGLPITLGLPTALATISLHTSTTSHRTRSTVVLDTLLHLFFPLACIITFVIHPVGKGAVAYASYWLIPMMLWVLRNTRGTKNIILFSLQSTFIAHAAGSIIWLYTVPMTACQWLSLIPVVAVERFVIAGLSSILFYGVMASRLWFKKRGRCTHAQRPLFS